MGPLIGRRAAGGGTRARVDHLGARGTTGARGDLPPDLPEFIARVRRHTELPLAVGFGVSRPEHVAKIGQLCEAAVIGSAIIDVIEQAPPDQRAEQLRGYIARVTGHAR